MPQQQPMVPDRHTQAASSPAACLHKAEQQLLNLNPLTRMSVASIWQARMGWLSWK